MAEDAGPHTPLDIEYLQGIHISDSVLWLDAPRRADLCFISHAHQGPALDHRKVLLTAATAALCGRRLSAARALISPLYRRFSLGGLDLELFPAGHVTGAAQLSVERDSQRLVYTGHWCDRPQRLVEPGHLLQADVLVLSAVYGESRFRFPPRERIESEILAWVQRSLTAGENPALLCASLGTSQELLVLLSAAGLTCRLHPKLAAACEAVSGLGTPLPPAKRLRGGVERDEVLLLPLWPSRGARGRPGQAGPRPVRRAAVTGLALAPERLASLGVDLGFPLSSLADHDDLVRYARHSGAGRMFLVGAGAEELAAELRAAGLRAWPLTIPRQLDLFEPRRRPTRRPADRYGRDRQTAKIRGKPRGRGRTP